jgi:hypothetical protein
MPTSPRGSSLLGSPSPETPWHRRYVRRFSGSSTEMAIITGGQGWEQIGDLALAFALSSLIGLERCDRSVP